MKTIYLKDLKWPAYLFISILFFVHISTSKLYAQTISGAVYEYNNQTKEQLPLPAANIYWANTTQGTISQADGSFNLPVKTGTNKLVATFMGYQNDTIEVSAQATDVTFILLPDGNQLDEVVVVQRNGGTYISQLQSIKTEVLTTAELQKLPCCNLSESFENSASVDVSFSDAVTGAKQIQMLGLAGTYTQILNENMPAVRGLSANYGLSFIPGSWMESIQVSKGSSAVINGYESISGQINVEYLKPEKTDKLFLNIYANNEGRVESNLASAWKKNSSLSGMVLAHASSNLISLDHNHDGFLDVPTGKQLNTLVRGKYTQGRSEGQLGVKLLSDNRNGGQIGLMPPESSLPAYAININTQRVELFGKFGTALNKAFTKSIGNTVSASYLTHHFAAGGKVYDASQKSLYINSIYQSILNVSNHQIHAGVSLIADQYMQNLSDYNKPVLDEQTSEIVPGVFAQYTYKYTEKADLIAGIRADYSSLHGLFFTPRIHARYHFDNNIVIRASAGKGYRTPYVIAENTSLLASSRQIIIDTPLKQEEAWNFGGNIHKQFELPDKRKASISADFYHTRFINQAVIDMDTPREIHIYNLNGKSYSNSIQADVMIEPVKRFEISAAYRWNDVQVSQHGELVQKAFTNKYKALLTFSYRTRFDKWQIDLTNQLHGPQHMPDLSQLPSEYQLAQQPQPYYIGHTQLTRRFKHWEVYTGIENITGFKQKNPIISADNPFDPNFDASMVWGPINGRMYYAGLRLNVK